MSTQGTNLGVVGRTMQDLLDTVNEGFNWDMIKERFDEHPEGTAMSVHFTDESGEQAVEEIYLAIEDGPEMKVLDQLTPAYDYIGAIVTYQSYGLKILDVDDPMTPADARFQYGGVTVHPHGDESRARVWFVVEKVLDTMLETLIYKQQAEAGDQEKAEGD